MGGTYRSDEPRYEKGDRVWVQRGGAAREPGVVIGYYVDWSLYRVVYTVDLADQGPRALEEWRLTFRKKEEGHRQADTPASETLTSEGASPKRADKPSDRAPC